ncbi:HNH endonuclease signature motif containing protein [Pyruvatibacter mobilis]|uniref:HNH endonuclease signature motif containing protein n=1 Tax=Pyruvatibacter mobilis TaxID=1712261 RepID=UPI003BAA9344
MPSFRPQRFKGPELNARSADAARPSAAQRGYDWRWQKYVTAFRARHPLCRRHMDLFDRPVPVAHVDHIERVTGRDDPRFWQPENHQPLCRHCHHVKTQAEIAGAHFTAARPYPDAQPDELGG